MSAFSMNSPETTMDSTVACDRFFAIQELVELFLRQTDALVLLKCQQVCRRWKQIIDHSNNLQEHLFLRPCDSEQANSAVVDINPILQSHFAAILHWSEDCSPSPSSPRRALRSKMCEYHDLTTLAWARDGTNEDATSRRAFATEHASWRRMLISQPPITRLDWWHSWECAERGSNGHPLISGEGHEYSNEPLTIGLLWDWIEARLLRGCQVQTTIFTIGCPTVDDPTASAHERGWEVGDTKAMQKGFSARHPRIRVQSSHVWPGPGPSMYQEFQVPHAIWRIQLDVPFNPITESKRRMYSAYSQNGWMWLALDCRRDSESEAAATTWRWSKSDAFQGVELRRNGCLGPGGNRREAWRRQGGSALAVPWAIRTAVDDIAPALG